MKARRFRLFRGWVLSVLPALAHSVSSDASDPTELLKRVVANIEANRLKAQNYTFVEDYHEINYDKKGKITYDHTAKYETVMIEGTPYRRQVEDNGKPLSGKAAAEEERKYQATVAERRRMNAELKQTLFHREVRYNADPASWPILFKASSGDEAVVEGRTLLKLVLSPRSDVKPESDEKKDALHTSIQLWIDKADEMPVHMRTEFISDGTHLRAGTTMDLFWTKEELNGTYLRVRSLSQYRAKFFLAEVPGQSEQKFSNYKRFSVDVRIKPQPSQPQ
ncbi:MAG TPA: hypothetical protein VI488_06355 [Candidatus Angelobacter sp.]